MSRPVVADAGPLIHLEQTNALSLLELTGKVLVPKTVLDELEDGPTDISEVNHVSSRPESTTAKDRRSRLRTKDRPGS